MLRMFEEIIRVAIMFALIRDFLVIGAVLIVIGLLAYVLGSLMYKLLKGK